MAHVAVLIPAHNEDHLVARCLRSVSAALSRLPSTVTHDIVVVSDHSTDSTVERAWELLRGRGIVVASALRGVGAARELAARVALDRTDVPLSSCWLANTDADSEVPADWVVAQLALAANGALVVAGMIDVVDFEGHDDGVEARFRATYTSRPDHTHSHVHGANLGVRADVYRAAGGFSGLTTGEDHDFWERVQKVTLPEQRRQDARIVVTTSGRREGRAPHGFAAALAAHNASASDASNASTASRERFPEASVTE